MIVIDNEIKKHLLNDSIYREVIIRFPNASDTEISEIGSENVLSESLELTQSVCDDSEFKLGGCIAGQLKIQLIGIEQALNNKRINVFVRQTYSSGELLPSETLYPSEDLYPGMRTAVIEKQIFSGTINSSVRQKNRAIKEIIAYDDIYVMSQTKVKNWIENYIMYSFKSGTTTLRDLLLVTIDVFETATGLYIGSGRLPIGFNDSTKPLIEYDLVTSAFSKSATFADLLAAYCELNSCFAVISETGVLNFVKLYKQKTSTETEKKSVDEVIEQYADLEFEEYITRPINRIRFTQNKDQNKDYGYSSEKSSWYISDNLITKSCTDAGNLVVAFNSGGNNYIFGDLFSYRPFSAEVFGRWWIEPGDKIQIKTGYNDVETVESFVFERTIKGINSMRISLSAKGTEFLGKDEIDNEFLQQA